MTEVSSLALGIAAEHLVCADLIMKGYSAYLTDQTRAYDVVADLGILLLRVQVKATAQPHPLPQRSPLTNTLAYQWHVRRAGKGGARVYRDDEFDLLALVAMDIQRIAYLPLETKSQTVHIRPPGTTGGKQFEDLTLEAALAS